jgi:rubrerythrin
MGYKPPNKEAKMGKRRREIVGVDVDKLLVEQNIGAERCAIDVYDKLVKMVEGKDGKIYNIVQEILDDEIEHEASFSFRTSKSGTINALLYCNIHGLWENSKKLEVK